MPQGITGCPPGLEYLTQIDQILVHQQIELIESKFKTTCTRLFYLNTKLDSSNLIDGNIIFTSKLDHYAFRIHISHLIRQYILTTEGIEY